MRLRWMLRPLKVSPHGTRHVAFGVGCGYWPCLSAPYIKVVFLFWCFELWFGKEASNDETRGY